MKYAVLMALLPAWVLAQQPFPQPPFPPQGMPIAPRPDVLTLLPYEGSEIFRFLLHRHGLKPLTDVDQALNDPQNTMIIIHGDTPELRDFYNLSGQSLRAFINNGGAVLIAGDDRADNRVNTWSSTFGLQRDGVRLKAAAPDCYKGVETRPYVRPLMNQVQLMLREKTSPHHIFASVKWDGTNGVATDLPSTMYLKEWNPNGLTRIPLATYPQSSDYVVERKERLDLRDCYFAIAFTANRGSGRMLILADHSVFVNGMSGFKRDPNAENGLTLDNYNSVFVKQMTDWLQAGGAAKRTRCLFIEDGSIVEKFAQTVTTSTPNQQKPPIPPITPDVVAVFGNALLEAMNKKIDEAEERDAFNRALVRAFGRERFVKLFLIVLAAWAGFFALRRFALALWKVNPSAAPPPQTLEAMLPHGGILQQRVDAQIDVNNFYEAARLRVRDRYDRMGGQPTTAGKIPPVLIASGGVDAERLLETICGLWLIGYGTKPVHIGPGEWDNMNRDLEGTLKRARRGEWSFGQEL